MENLGFVNLERHMKEVLENRKAAIPESVKEIIEAKIVSVKELYDELGQRNRRIKAYIDGELEIAMTKLETRLKSNQEGALELFLADLETQLKVGGDESKGELAIKNNRKRRRRGKEKNKKVC